MPVQLQLKWPNDVLLNGKKLAGLLIEREGDALIIGLGVNLQHAPPVTDGRYESIALRDFPDPELVEGLEENHEKDVPLSLDKLRMTHLHTEAIHHSFLAPKKFAEAWYASLQHWLAIWQQQDFPAIKAAWLAHHPPIGAPLQIKRENTIINGTFAGLAADGALQLQTDTALHTLHTADVFFPHLPVTGD